MENKILYFDILDSTNVKARELALAGAESGTVVVADGQTAGRGRRGRSWDSPAGTNVYMSILLKPELEVSKASMLTLVMAYSAAQVLRENGFKDTRIKWPNDLVISGKKVCGILTEMELDGAKIGHVVIGVGINANINTFPEELVDKATSLLAECGKEVNRRQLVEQICKRFWSDYEQFLMIGNLELIKDEYNQILVNAGKEVCVLEPGNEYRALASGINEQGELLVTKEDGSQEAIFAGEVSVRGIYGYV